MSTDPYLPALPVTVKYFNTSVSLVNLTIILFLFFMPTDPCSGGRSAISTDAGNTVAGFLRQILFQIPGGEIGDGG